MKKSFLHFVFGNRSSRLLVALCLSVCSLIGNAQTVIDVLVVHSPGVNTLYGADITTRVNQLFQVTNTIYKNSGINVEVRLAGIERVEYSDVNNAQDALRDITFNREFPVGSGVFPFRNVEARRAAVNADMVVFYRPYAQGHGSCGVAWVLDFKNAESYTKSLMYSHVAVNSCGDYVTAHELGHNMGLSHSRLQDGQGAVYPFALGHGVNQQFTTIMAYQTAFNVDYWTGKVYKFSNPNIICKDNLPCGVDRNDAQNGADASYSINYTGPLISKLNANYEFRNPKVSGRILGAPMNYVSGTTYFSTDTVDYIAKSTADHFCWLHGLNGAASYTTNSNYGNGHVFAARGNWWDYGGQAFKEINQITCVNQSTIPANEVLFIAPQKDGLVLGVNQNYVPGTTYLSTDSADSVAMSTVASFCALNGYSGGGSFAKVKNNYKGHVFAMRGQWWPQTQLTSGFFNEIIGLRCIR